MRRISVLPAITISLLISPIITVQCIAAEPSVIALTLNADSFSASEIVVPTNSDFSLKIHNASNAAAEIEAKDLDIEKVVVAGGDIIVKVKAVDAGRYLIVNEYKEDTVNAFIVAK